MNYKKVSLDEILGVIGDDVGRKYSWLLIEVEAIGYDMDNKEIWGNLTWGEISDQCDNEKFYPIEWEYLKKITTKIRTVTSFIFYGCENKEEYLKKLKEALKKGGSNPDCELKFEVFDSEIWDIKGTDRTLVERLKKHFYPLPIMVV
ncbi:MAG TPA: hypothetical protein VNK03_05585 [Gammaproteobacteria bacterium]|nr:hypothetical protein [Gammaproteobacteria bacterium]